MDNRFLRISRLIGTEKQKKLAESHVTVVGLGAVGGYAVEGLARSGIGHLRIVDFDTLGLTNINRQLLALESTLGLPKTEAAKERILQINPECEVEALQLFAHEETLGEILGGRVDALVDAIDALVPKMALLAGAWEAGIPTFSSMGAALRRDPFALQCADLMETRSCPLARQIRKKLRRRGVGAGITALFSTEEVSFDYRDPEEEDQPQHNEQIIERGRRRRVLGSLPTVTGIFGLTLAQLVIDKLLED